MPDDPPRALREAFEEAAQEIRAEVELRRRRGSLVRMPQGEDLKRVVEDRLGVRFADFGRGRRKKMGKDV